MNLWLIYKDHCVIWNDNDAGGLLTIPKIISYHQEMGIWVNCWATSSKNPDWMQVKNWELTPQHFVSDHPNLTMIW